MPYAELLRALEDEVARQSREAAASAEVERRRLIEEATKAVASEREAVAREERAEADDRHRHRLARAEIEREQEIVAGKRKVMERLRSEVLGRLIAEDDRWLPLLVAEALAGVSTKPTAFIADPGRSEALRAYLGRAHAKALEGSSVQEASSPRGGVEIVAGRGVHDNTWVARLQKAWPEIEGAVAEVLFGGGDGAV